MFRSVGLLCFVWRCDFHSPRKRNAMICFGIAKLLDLEIFWGYSHFPFWLLNNPLWHSIDTQRVFFHRLNAGWFHRLISQVIFRTTRCPQQVSVGLWTPLTTDYLVGGLEHLDYFPINIGLHSSSQLTNSYFSEGWPNHQPVIVAINRSEIGIVWSPTSPFRKQRPGLVLNDPYIQQTTMGLVDVSRIL